MVWRPQFLQNNASIGWAQCRCCLKTGRRAWVRRACNRHAPQNASAEGAWRPWRRSGPKSSWRAPQSLTQAMEEGATGKGAGGPRVQATPEAFVERCQTLPWRFFANLYEAFVAQVLPQAPLRAAAPLHPLRERFAEGWSVDGSRLDAVAHRRKRLREGRARVLPGCVTAFYDLYRGITRHLHCNPDAAAGARPRATAARTHVPQGTLLVGDRL